MSTREAATIHTAADALAAYGRDTFWRGDSGFHRSTRYSYEAAAAWLHEHAEGVNPASNPDDLVHAFAPAGDALSLCGDDGISTTTNASAVTCGWCRVKTAALRNATETHDAQPETTRTEDEEPTR